eukprot:COSAG06_NODE_1545_length_9134_cov_4.929939_2_plen_41_part_00
MFVPSMSWYKDRIDIMQMAQNYRAAYCCLSSPIKAYENHL